MKLIAESLSKSYSGKKIVTEVSIEVKRGEVVGLLGPNGAGKTTFFYMISGLEKSDSGKIILDNEEITHKGISARSKKGLSYLAQEPSIFRALSVKDNIKSSLEQRGNLKKEELLKETETLIEDFNLSNFSETKGIKLSGGERRRTEIARALALKPNYLLLDEPFAGIDPIAVSELKIIIKSLKKRDIGILISDHNVRETMKICDKILIMSEGKELATGTPDEVKKNKLVKEIYLGNTLES
tara:strand:+ start:46771 stop:47493 length:723 start_codon:yes stop_codon:yes gene_type:complete